MRKIMNTIWNVQNDVRVKEKKVQENFEVGTLQLQSLFKDPKEENIVEIVKISSLLPRFMEDNQN